MKTLLQICQEIGNTTNSEFKKNIFSMADVKEDQLDALNEALDIIWNESEYWDFRYDDTTFNTEEGVSSYTMVNGIIKEKGVYIEDKTLPLPYITDPENYLNSSVIGYYIENNKIVLIGTPQEVKTVTVKYQKIYPVLLDSTEKNYFESADATAVLNIDSRIEKAFINCLKHLTNNILNADSTDEEYTEHLIRYNKALQILKRVDKGTEDNYIKLVIQ